MKSYYVAAGCALYINEQIRVDQGQYLSTSEVEDCLQAGYASKNKITAIKALRDLSRGPLNNIKWGDVTPTSVYQEYIQRAAGMTAMGLKQAKDWVDIYWANAE